MEIKNVLIRLGMVGLTVAISIGLIACMSLNRDKQVKLCRDFCSNHNGFSLYSEKLHVCKCQDGTKLRF